MATKRKRKQPVQLHLFELGPSRPQVEQAESADMFEGHEIRRIEKSGRRWWVFADVCKVLGIANNRDASDRLNDDEKDVVSTDTLGGTQKLVVVNEAGLYHFALTVRLRKDNPAYEKVNRFRRWVCHEVLPEIRKTGKYTGKKPIDKITSIQNRLGCDRRTAAAREESIRQSKESHRLLAKHNAKPRDYQDHNDGIYKEMFNHTARELRPMIGLKPRVSPMDAMSHFVLSQLNHAKALGDKMAELQEVESLAQRKAIVQSCVRFVRDQDFLQLGPPGTISHAIVEDETRGPIIDVVQRQLPA